jgi:hypothetical protein
MNMRALKGAFTKSVALQYANFMPGEWLPAKDIGYLRAIYKAARELKVGVGGPDLVPYKKGQMNHSYPLIRESAGIVPIGLAVQDGDYEFNNPNIGKPGKINEQLQFASDYLKVDYIFWCTQEPFYSRDLIPLMKK